MALTNLASVGPDVQSRIIQGEAIKTFESLIFSDNIMIRRGSTELMCNLMYSPSVFDRYVNCGNSSRLKLMVALSDCEDYETKRAASGVLAILSSSKEGTLSLSKEKRFFEVLETLLNHDSLELLHRSFEILKNCLNYIPSRVPQSVKTCALKTLNTQIRKDSSLKSLSQEILTQIEEKRLETINTFF